MTIKYDKKIREAIEYRYSKDLRKIADGHIIVSSYANDDNNADDREELAVEVFMGGVKCGLKLIQKLNKVLSNNLKLKPEYRSMNLGIYFASKEAEDSNNWNAEDVFYFVGSVESILAKIEKLPFLQEYNGSSILLKQCKKQKSHLKSCDNDGYCNFCGNQ